MLADLRPARLVKKELTINKQSHPSTSQIAAASVVAAMAPSQCPTPIEQAMATADASLSFEQKSPLEVIINKYSDVFSLGPEDMGRIKLIHHQIDIINNESLCKRLRRIPHKQISFLKTNVDKLHKITAIESLISTLTSPTVLVTKKDGTMRLCINYRKFYSITKKDPYQLSLIEEIFDKLLDLNCYLHWILRWGTIM